MILLDGKKEYFESHIKVANNLIHEFPMECHMKTFLETYRDSPEAKIADSLLQPVEHSYTVNSLGTMLDGCNLEYLAPCINQFDKYDNKFSWHIPFRSADIRSAYENLPDIQRWQVSNLLLQENSPGLWFYCQRKDSSLRPLSEKQISHDFLNSKFRKSTTTVENYVLNEQGAYTKINRKLQFPSPAQPANEGLKTLFDFSNGTRTMAEIFDTVGLPTDDFATTLEARTQLTTPLFPYLSAV
jgi:hypothetical protein